MKRALYGAAVVLALTLGSGSAAAHVITVTPVGEGVGTSHDLARNLTPRYFDGRGNYIGEGGSTSAASNGTSTACWAVPADGPVSITAGRGACPP